MKKTPHVNFFAEVEHLVKGAKDHRQPTWRHEVGIDLEGVDMLVTQ
jgi:hypothetical protein